jgi:hypothetical protein
MSSTFDASIPVLTEVLVDEPVSTAAALPAATTTAIAVADVADVADAAEVAAAAPSAPGGLSEADLAALEQRLAERILQQLQGRIDFVLEQGIKDKLAEVLDHALRDLTGEIRSGLQLTLEKVVARAVSQELAHLQVHKK